jgi:hypothetical protein
MDSVSIQELGDMGNSKGEVLDQLGEVKDFCRYLYEEGRRPAAASAASPAAGADPSGGA